MVYYFFTLHSEFCSAMGKRSGVPASVAKGTIPLAKAFAKTTTATVEPLEPSEAGTQLKEAGAERQVKKLKLTHKPTVLAPELKRESNEKSGTVKYCELTAAERKALAESSKQAFSVASAGMEQMPESLDECISCTSEKVVDDVVQSTMSKFGYPYSEKENEQPMSQFMAADTAEEHAIDVAECPQPDQPCKPVASEVMVTEKVDAAEGLTMEGQDVGNLAPSLATQGGGAECPQPDQPCKAVASEVMVTEKLDAAEGLTMEGQDGEGEGQSQGHISNSELAAEESELMEALEEELSKGQVSIFKLPCNN